MDAAVGSNRRRGSAAAINSTTSLPDGFSATHDRRENTGEPICHQGVPWWQIWWQIRGKRGVRGDLEHRWINNLLIHFLFLLGSIPRRQPQPLESRIQEGICDTRERRFAVILFPLEPF